VTYCGFAIGEDDLPRSMTDGVYAQKYGGARQIKWMLLTTSCHLMNEYISKYKGRRCSPPCSTWVVVVSDGSGLSTYKEWILRLPLTHPYFKAFQNKHRYSNHVGQRRISQIERAIYLRHAALQ